MAAEGTKDEDVATVLAELEEEMLAAADRLEFEKAALLRDQIALLKKGTSGSAAPTKSKPYYPAVKAKARRRK
jgi:excinuclease ABC subunit B